MNQQPSAEESFDQEKLSLLRRQVAINKSELLQLAYDDERFTSKLQELNKLGCEAILSQNFQQAIIYLNQAENILEYAASCGKTIQRTLITTTLQNQACVYHRVWQLQKSTNYIQAIIYNITTFLQAEKSTSKKDIQEQNSSKQVLNEDSDQYAKIGIYLKNKLQLVFYYLQYCAVSSQNQNHQNALSSASKALTVLKSLCQQQYNYERLYRKNKKDILPIDEQNNSEMLFELHSIKECKQQSFESIQKIIQKFLIKAKKTIFQFQKKLKSNQQKYPKIQKQIQTYSIGNVMQINPIFIPKMHDVIHLKEQFQYLKKIYKAIYISIAHFTLATQLRLLSNERYTLDPTQRRNSIQFKSSQIHHLISIITAGVYVPCQTVYFQHIINSFKNHYQIDLTQDSQISLSIQTWNGEEDDLIHLETSSINNKKTTLTQKEQNSKLKTSSKKYGSGIQIGSPEIHKQLQNKMSKKKLISIHQSQKSGKSNDTSNQRISNTPIQLKTSVKSKSKSKGKNLKKSGHKQEQKSRKKSSRKIEQKVNSPSPHKKKNIQGQQKKKINQVKSTSRSKSKKKISRSKHLQPQLSNNSKEKGKIIHSQNYNNFVTIKKQDVNHHYQNIPPKNLLVRSNNNVKELNKQKKQIAKKNQKQSIQSAPTTESLTFKFIKKVKSPQHLLRQGSKSSKKEK